jgi:RND family efflux transporter MFP subunit
VIAVFVSFLTIGGYSLLDRSRENIVTAAEAPLQQVQDTSDQSSPVADVEIIQVREGTLSKLLPAYGSVIPAPGAQRVVSVPFECQVLEIFVSDGQKISKGSDLVDIQPSPATSLQLEDATNNYKLEQESLNQVERKLSLKLATNDQVLQAKQRVELARTKLENLIKQGIMKRRRLSASSGGLVKKVNVQEGNIVAAGNPLIEMVAENQLQVKLGVEPEDLSGVLQGQEVQILHVNDPTMPAVSGHISRLSYQLDSSTRLVDVFVKIPTPVTFLLGETIYAQIKTGSVQGLIVPRSSVLPEGSRFYIFTVRDGVAHKHYVRIIYETEKQYVISGDGVVAGDHVVSLGNYTLKDGMQVQVKAAQ